MQILDIAQNVSCAIIKKMKKSVKINNENMEYNSRMEALIIQKIYRLLNTIKNLNN